MDIGKDLVAASSTPLILSILADDGESYGYAIVKRVSELSNGTLQWTEGMLYPLLHRLERQGDIEGRWGAAESGRKRKYYRITKSGRAHLTDQRRQWQAVDKALRNVWRGLSRTAGLAGPITATSEGG